MQLIQSSFIRVIRSIRVQKQNAKIQLSFELPKISQFRHFS